MDTLDARPFRCVLRSNAAGLCLAADGDRCSQTIADAHLLTVRTWLQIHIYLGLFACLAYVVHVPMLIARGPLECALSFVFLFTAASGLYGLYQSRTVPRRLTNLNVQPRYDRIAWHRAHLAQAAEQTIAGLPHSAAADLLRDFYFKRLAPYFESRISLLYRIHPTGIRRRRLLSAISDLERYLDPQTIPKAQQLAGLARQCDDLNFHHALQFRLRAWLVFHATISMGLVVLAIVHTVSHLECWGIDHETRRCSPIRCTAE